MKLVIIGLGSIGLKHKTNLENLGHKVIPCHRNDDLKKVINRVKPDGVLICNPTAKHLESAKICLEAQVPTFIEKPLSHNLDGVNELIHLFKTSRTLVLIGYCLRFNTQLRKLKQKLLTVKPEQIRSVKIVCKSWLPDWRPGTDYRQSYSAKKELGGGVLLDLSHEIDYALWFFGQVKTVKAKLQVSPELKIETEAVADLDIEFLSGIRAEFYLSYASRQPDRFCEIKVSDQTLRWDYQPNNEMYLEEMKHFIKVVKGQEKPLITVDEARQVLKVIAAAKKSSQSGKIEKV